MNLQRVILTVALLGCSAADAASFRVRSTADSYDGVCDHHCSLRDAVAAANASVGADTIILPPGVYRIQIPTPPAPTEDGVGDEDANAAGDFDVADTLLIRGDREDPPIVDAAARERIFEILGDAVVELRDLDLRNGYTPNLGGALLNSGVLKLTRVRVSASRAASGFDVGRGGGAANLGRLTVVDSVFEGNEASGGEASLGEGGGIYNLGTLQVRRSRFIANRTLDDNDIGGGGGIMNRGGRATIDRAFFQGNGTSSGGTGGAVANRSDGALILVNATVTGNSSGSAGQDGGGAVANGTRHGDAGVMSLRYTTIAENVGGGLLNSGHLRWYNSIVVGNYERVGIDERDYHAGMNCLNFGRAAGSGIVLGADGNCTGNANFDNATAFDQLLFPLHYHGGFAPTYMPRPEGGWIIDMASDAVACPATDMRGALRPFDADGDGQPRCDIGSFELETPLPP